MTASHVDVPGGRLFVLDDGAGPPLILLHAGIADLRAWDAIVAPLTAAGYRVIRFDARGFGASTTEDVEFSPRDDLRAVMDALGIVRAVLVGNSRGGMLAIDTAIETPERVVAVVGVAAGLAGFDGGTTQAESAIEAEYDRIDAAGDAAALTAFETRIWVDGPLQPAGRVAARIRDLVDEMNLPLNEAGHVAGRPIPLAPPARDRLAELRCPILLVVGSLDFSDVVTTARHVEAEASDARVVIWPDVAHMIGMEVPDRLAETVVEFLAPIPPWG
jgi:pimeloyl-ACP methyl ester carboxylesterase